MSAPAFEIFDAKGRMLPLDQIEPHLAEADDATRERFEAVRAAVSEHDEIAGALKASETRVGELMKEAASLESYIRTTWPAQNREAAIREYLQTERMKRR